MQNLANDDTLSISNNSVNINAQAVGISNFNGASLSRITTPTYRNTRYGDNITIEKLTTTQQSILSDYSLSLTDIFGNNSLLTPTNLTFNGLPYNRNMVNCSLIYSSALIYADGSAPSTNLLIRNTYSYNGWYFAKTLPGTAKINWYLGAQSNNTTVSEIKGIAMSFFNQLATNNDYLPFITIYTQQQPGDLTFYHSKRTYIFNQSLTPTVNTAYQGCVFVDPTLIPYYRETQIQLVKLVHFFQVKK